jgi:hypothetical protein
LRSNGLTLKFNRCWWKSWRSLSVTGVRTKDVDSNRSLAKTDRRRFGTSPLAKIFPNWNQIQFFNCTVMWRGIRKSGNFWGLMPYSTLKVTCRLGGTCCLYLQGQRISQTRSSTCYLLHASSCLVYSSPLKMEAIYSIKMSGDFQWTSQHYILEDGKNFSCCDDLKF